MQTKYDYTKFPITDLDSNKIIGHIYKPYISIRVGNPKSRQISKFPMQCLIDSGADSNLLPAVLGEVAGINILKGEPKIINGIGNSEIKAYRHFIKIYLGTTSFNTVADFSYEQKVALLGRDGFFDIFKSVSFYEKLKTFELET